MTKRKIFLLMMLVFTASSASADTLKPDVNSEAEAALTEGQERLAQEVGKAQKQLSEAQETLAQEETEAFQSPGETSEALVVAKAELAKYLAATADEQLRFLEKISGRKKRLEEIQEQLQRDLKNEKNGSIALRQRLDQAASTWEIAGEFISELFVELKIHSSVELPSRLHSDADFGESDREEYARYLQEYAKAQKERSVVVKARTDLLDELRSQGFRVLSDSGQLRARLILRCDQVDECWGHRDLTQKNLDDIVREMKVIPVKIQAGGLSKMLELRGKIDAGLDGWLDLSHQILALFLLFFIPFVVIRSLSWLTSKLDDVRRSILAKSLMDFRRRTSLAMWISRLNPFIPSGGMVIGVWLARRVVSSTDFRELSDFLFYFQLYFVYRFFMLAVKISLEVVFSTDSISLMKQRRDLAETSARRISRLIFFEYAVLHLVESTARKALIYGIFSSVFFYFNVFFLFWECYRWQRQIQESFHKRFPDLEGPLAWLKARKAFNFFANPFLFAAVVAHDLAHYVYGRLIRLDFVKRINSEFFRRRLKNDEEVGREAPPKEYLKLFDFHLPATPDIFVRQDNSVAERILYVISLWQRGASTDDLAIVIGNRGMGKTTVLQSVIEEVLPGEKVHRVPFRILKAEAFFAWISEILEVRVSSMEEFVAYDRSLDTKRVLFIDDIQNLFLGVIGGFEGYRMFVEIVSLRTTNIFWCVSMNSRSWSYIKGAFGGEHLYGKIYELAPWRDHEIQKLILSRHDATGYERQFDKSIKAYGATDDSLGQRAETQFFRLLWGQSRGNPRSALMYWISAVKQLQEEKILVGVPSFVDPSLVSLMSDEALFLLAAISRHESLSKDELMAVTAINGSVIRKCMKEALDKNLIWLDENGRYRIASRAQYMIDYYLVGKNFLYE